MWINITRQGLFDKYKIINQLQIHCSGAGMLNYPHAGWCGSQPTLARSGYWGCVNLWSVSQVSEGTKILSEEPAGWWCSQHRHCVSHDSTNFSLSYWIHSWARRNWSREIPDFMFWIKWSTCTPGVMNQDKTQSIPLLYKHIYLN